jgi:hypothetical protein
MWLKIICVCKCVFRPFQSSSIWFDFIYVRKLIIIHYHLGVLLPFDEHNFFFSEVFLLSHKFLSNWPELILVWSRFEHLLLAIIDILLLHILFFPLNINHWRPYICSSFVCNTQRCFRHVPDLISIFSPASLNPQCGCWGWKYSE